MADHLTMEVEAVPRYLHLELRAQHDRLVHENAQLRYDKQRARRSLDRIAAEVSGDPGHVSLAYIRVEALRGLKRKARPEA